ncbi:hypothetical protein GCM10009527_040620 [Actinomadura nitritigenes]
MPTRDSAALGRSHGPGDGSFDSGSSRAPATTSTAITGRLIRKTEPHQKRSSSRPPTRGPTAAPAETPEAQIPMAMERSRASVKMFRISASVDGIRVAPATPIRARAAMSSSGPVA